MIRNVAYSIVLCFILFTAVGCGLKGDVDGTVTFRGKPVASGTVSLFASDDIQYTSPLAADGTYSMKNVPRGPAKFFVSSPNPGGGMRTGRAPDGPGDVPAPDPAPATQNSWFPIPDMYSDPNQSGLTGTISAKTTIDLDLK